MRVSLLKKALILLLAAFLIWYIRGFLYSGHVLGPFQMIWTSIHPDQTILYACSSGGSLTVQIHSRVAPWGLETGGGGLVKEGEITFTVGAKSLRLSAANRIGIGGYGFGYPIDTIFIFSPDVRALFATPPIQKGKQDILYEGFSVYGDEASKEETKALAGCLREHAQSISWAELEPTSRQSTRSVIGYVMHLERPQRNVHYSNGSVIETALSHPAHVFTCASGSVKIAGKGSRADEIWYSTTNGQSWAHGGRIAVDGTLPNTYSSSESTRGCVDASGITLQQFLSQTAPKIILLN